MGEDTGKCSVSSPEINFWQYCWLVLSNFALFLDFYQIFCQIVERHEKGKYEVFVKNLCLLGRYLFFKSFQISPAKLEQPYYIFGPLITQELKYCCQISGEEQFITLSHLVTPDLHKIICWESY